MSAQLITPKEHQRSRASLQSRWLHRSADSSNRETLKDEALDLCRGGSTTRDYGLRKTYLESREHTAIHTNHPARTLRRARRIGCGLCIWWDAKGFLGSRGEPARTTTLQLTQMSIQLILEISGLAVLMPKAEPIDSVSRLVFSSKSRRQLH